MSEAQEPVVKIGTEFSTKQLGNVIVTAITKNGVVVRGGETKVLVAFERVEQAMGLRP